jgi:hypothetical protein
VHPKPVLQAGVQRAVALYRGLGCPQKLLFLLAPPAAARKKREKGFLGTPQTPAGRTLHPRFWGLFQKSGMTHICPFCTSFYRSRNRPEHEGSVLLLPPSHRHQISRQLRRLFWATVSFTQPLSSPLSDQRNKWDHDHHLDSARKFSWSSCPKFLFSYPPKSVHLYFSCSALNQHGHHTIWEQIGTLLNV